MDSASGSVNELHQILQSPENRNVKYYKQKRQVLQSYSCTKSYRALKTDNSSTRLVNLHQILWGIV